mmetsp:Transcript_42276/g.122680  ORF Transcript_42276/g.122680 Transcript_42276/m.122680 type:complete len:236 (-) Transcript_42276:105-812(-)
MSPSNHRRAHRPRRGGGSGRSCRSNSGQIESRLNRPRLPATPSRPAAGSRRTRVSRGAHLANAPRLSSATLPKNTRTWPWRPRSIGGCTARSTFADLPQPSASNQSRPRAHQAERWAPSHAHCPPHSRRRCHRCPRTEPALVLADLVAALARIAVQRRTWYLCRCCRRLEQAAATPVSYQDRCSSPALVMAMLMLTPWGTAAARPRARALAWPRRGWLRVTGKDPSRRCGRWTCG